MALELLSDSTFLFRKTKTPTRRYWWAFLGRLSSLPSILAAESLVASWPRAILASYHPVLLSPQSSCLHVLGTHPKPLDFFICTFEHSIYQGRDGDAHAHVYTADYDGVASF